MLNIILLLLCVILIITVLSYILIQIFVDKNKIINKNLFKLIGNSGTAVTDISELFGIVSFKDDSGCDKNVPCFSYREKITKGFRVLITDYNTEKEMFIVDEYPK